jgi:hypothetical protein
MRTATPTSSVKNAKDFHGRQACAAYSTANSDRAGAVTTFWHEVVEACAHAEIVDECRAATFRIHGVRVSRYQVMTAAPCASPSA